MYEDGTFDVLSYPVTILKHPTLLACNADFDGDSTIITLLAGCFRLCKSSSFVRRPKLGEQHYGHPTKGKGFQLMRRTCTASTGLIIGRDKDSAESVMPRWALSAASPNA